MDDIKKAIEYVADNIDLVSLRYAATRCDIERCPLNVIDRHLSIAINDYMEEYGADHDLPEGWWWDWGDEEDIMWEVLKSY